MAATAVAKALGLGLSAAVLVLRPAVDRGVQHPADAAGAAGSSRGRRSWARRGASSVRRKGWPSHWSSMPRSASPDSAGDDGNGRQFIATRPIGTGLRMPSYGTLTPPSWLSCPRLQAQGARPPLRPAGGTDPDVHRGPRRITSRPARPGSRSRCPGGTSGSPPTRWTRCASSATPTSAPGERAQVCCGGGIGRTGTALSAICVFEGMDPKEAVKWVRRNYHPLCRRGALAAALRPPGPRREHRGTWLGRDLAPPSRTPSGRPPPDTGLSPVPPAPPDAYLGSHDGNGRTRRRPEEGTRRHRRTPGQLGEEYRPRWSTRSWRRSTSASTERWSAGCAGSSPSSR
ncbi:hypothetical protein STENM327S_06748 [Streptomyces tendae]